MKRQVFALGWKSFKMMIVYGFMLMSQWCLIASVHAQTVQWPFLERVTIEGSEQNSSYQLQRNVSVLNVINGTRYRTRLKMLLKQDDQIMTSPQAIAVITSPTWNNSLTLEPNSACTIKSPTEAQVESGSIYAATAINTQHYFDVTTKFIDLEPRKTEFFVMVSGNDNVLVTVFNGTVRATSKLGLWQRDVHAFEQLAASGPGYPTVTPMGPGNGFGGSQRPYEQPWDGSGNYPIPSIPSTIGNGTGQSGVPYPRLVPVPQLVGMYIEGAAAQLQRVYLRVGQIRYIDQETAKRLYSTTRTTGSMALEWNVGYQQSYPSQMPGYAARYIVLCQSLPLGIMVPMGTAIDLILMFDSSMSQPRVYYSPNYSYPQNPSYPTGGYFDAYGVWHGSR